jgi:hypothetical protein
MFIRNYQNKYGLFLLISLMVIVFGLWGCDSGGDGGGGVNYGHDITVTVTDNTGQAIANFTVANVTVTTESGTVANIAVNGTQVTFSVNGIGLAQNTVTLSIDVTGYLPLIRQYLTTLTTVTDTSGDNFTSVMLLYAEVPTGGGAGDSDPTGHTPTTGTAADLSPTAPVDAGTGFQADGTLPQGTIFQTTGGGAVNEDIVMRMTFHQGIGTQETFYPGGSYGGNSPDAFGTISFVGNSSNDAMAPTANVNVALNLTFMLGATSSADLDYSYSDYVQATETTSACITDLVSGDTTTISDCSYDTVTEIYTCANGYYSFPSGTTVGTYRIDGGSCPTTTSTAEELDVTN